MECNIDAVGKAARMRVGIFGMIVSAIMGMLIVIGILEGNIWKAALVLSILGGAFTIFEARAGWCVVRAMGFKTRI